MRQQSEFSAEKKSEDKKIVQELEVLGKILAIFNGEYSLCYFGSFQQLVQILELSQDFEIKIITA